MRLSTLKGFAAACACALLITWTSPTAAAGDLLRPADGAWLPETGGPAQSENCEPSWISTFGGMHSVNGDIYALTMHDDGNGPALYAGGSFTVLGGLGATRVAKWDGHAWSALGGGLNASVQALVSFDDGNGPALYAGGSFTAAGEVPVNKIAKWDGVAWSAVGGGVDGVSASVLALIVYDDGNGPALYAGGSFSTAGGVSSQGIAKWDGTSWSALGSGEAIGSVHALTVYDDGSGPVLCAGGTFTVMGGMPANRIARWNGTSWSTFGSGMNGQVLTLTTFVSPTHGTVHLCAGGWFTSAGGSSTPRVARWSGSSWAPIGGFDQPVRSLLPFDDGSGMTLYAAGSFTSAGSSSGTVPGIARLSGSTWTPLGSGTPGVTHALVAADLGGGPSLYAGGQFLEMGGATGTNRLARWKSGTWMAVGHDLNDTVYALTAHDDGDGPALYAGGAFHSAGGVPGTLFIAKWNGIQWTTLGGQLNNPVLSLASYDDGNGPALYVAGEFGAVNGEPLQFIAKWSNGVWSSLDGGVNAPVEVLTVFDDGSGPALYAGGRFTLAGGVPAKGIAKWDGTSWSALGVEPYASADVYALASSDVGGVPFLYVGGDFQPSGGGAAFHILRWNGEIWWNVGGGGLNGSVRALAAYDDGNGEALYAGGEFTDAVGVPANHIAKWDGASWSALGSGMNDSVWTLAVFDDGGGEALYAGGRYTTAGGDSMSRIAKWNGAAWSSLGSGMNDWVRALTVYDDGAGSALFAGGGFLVGGGVLGSRMAKWGGCAEPPPPSPWTAVGGGLAGTGGLTPLLEGAGPASDGSLNDIDLSQALPFSQAHFVLGAAPLFAPFKFGTLVPTPHVILSGLPVSGAGTTSFPLLWPSGIPAGVPLWMQYWVVDPGGPAGFSASNGLQVEAQ